MIINMATDLFSRDWAGVDVRAPEGSDMDITL